MFFQKGPLTFVANKNTNEYVPRFHIDFYHLKEDFRRRFPTTFHFEIGIFGELIYLTLEFMSKEYREKGEKEWQELFEERVSKLEKKW